MKLVINKAAFRQICGILDKSRDKCATRVSLIGRRSGERVVVEATCRVREKSAMSSPAPNRVGTMFFHRRQKVIVRPDDDCRLGRSEKQHIREMLQEKNALVAVVTVIGGGGDLAFYPAFFSRQNPRGVDMALEHDGSTVCQQYSALGGCCQAPHKTVIRAHTCHCQVRVKVQGSWVAIDRGIARLVRLVNRIPGIASVGSCQGGKPNSGNSKCHSSGQAYLQLSPSQYLHDFFRLMHLNSTARETDLRLRETSLRLRRTFELRMGKPIAVTRARNADEAWKRRGIPKMYPKLRLGKLISAFRWDPKETPRMIDSVRDLLREEKKMIRAVSEVGKQG